MERSYYYFLFNEHLIHILVAQVQKTGLQCRRLSSVYFFRGRSKSGERPPWQTLQNAPLSFTSQPNLNLTMEPAQSACNPILGPGGADLSQCLLLAQNVLQCAMKLRTN